MPFLKAIKNEPLVPEQQPAISWIWENRGYMKESMTDIPGTPATVWYLSGKMPSGDPSEGELRDIPAPLHRISHESPEMPS